MFPLFNLCLCLTLNDPKQYRCLSISNTEDGLKGYIESYMDITIHQANMKKIYPGPDVLVVWGFYPGTSSIRAAGLLVFQWRGWLGEFEGGEKVSFLSIIGAVMLVSWCVLEWRPHYWYRPDTTLSWLASQVCLHNISHLSPCLINKQGHGPLSCGGAGSVSGNIEMEVASNYEIVSYILHGNH